MVKVLASSGAGCFVGKYSRCDAANVLERWMNDGWRTLHGESLPCSCLTVGEYSSVEAIHDGLHQVTERLIVKIILLRTGKYKFYIKTG